MRADAEQPTSARRARPGRTAHPRRTAIGLLTAVALVTGLAAAGVAASGAAEAPGSTASASTPMAWAGPDGRRSLASGWLVRTDAADVGRRRGWAAGRFGGTRRQLPYSPNARRVTYTAGRRSHRGSVAWYRRTVRVGRSGTYAIRFESVNHDAQVWLDGRPVARHAGEFEPFEARVRLRAGRSHRLVVRADWRNPTRMKREGWHRLWFNYGGITREVTLRRLGRWSLEAPRVRTRLRADGAAEVDLSVVVANRGSRGRVAAAGALTRDGATIPFGLPATTLARGQRRRVRTTVVVPSPALWQPGSPALYELRLAAPGAGYRQRIGLREVRREGRRLLLNGRRMQLRGASLHEDLPGQGTALTPSSMDRIVADLRGLGATATRAQHPLSPALVERLDAAGILLWQGIGPTDSPGAWSATTSRLRARARGRTRRSVDQLQAHPSVVVWNLVNEIAGNGRADGQVQHLTAMTRELRRTDPGRLIALDLWGKYPPERMGPVWAEVDAVGVTKYLGWYEEPTADPARLRASIERYAARIERVFADKALVLTEFGAEGNTQNPDDQAGGLGYQTSLLRTSIAAYGARPAFSGALVWNLRDFGVSPSFGGGSIHEAVGRRVALVPGLNQKGLLTYGGRAKPAYTAAREAFAREAQLARASGRSAY